MVMVRFLNDQFFRSHGALPKGCGGWAFKVEHASTVGMVEGEVFFSPSMTFTEAKAWMTQQVRREAAEDARNVFVSVQP